MIEVINWSATVPGKSSDSFSLKNRIKFGWRPGFSDIRDFTIEKIIPSAGKSRKRLPEKHILEENLFSPIEDQRDIGSCTANAAAGIIEYLEKKVKGTHIDVSRLFLYKVTRMLMGVTGDTGAYLRDTMKAMRLFGLLPESYWPYVPSTFDKEPTAFQYSIAANYKSLSYFRVDTPGMTQDQILLSVKQRLSKNIPLMCGFVCYSSLYSAQYGVIPTPTNADTVIGGHAVTLVGYDDSRSLLKLRNSWGTSWGQNGYGWIPYSFVQNGLLFDIWGVLKQDWVDTGVFAE